jgi:phospholipid/cholesterol/gamma-HCH transport system permease protein
MNFFAHLGRYFLLIKRTFGKPERHRLYLKQIFREIDNLGIRSLGIAAIISFFIGMVVIIHMTINMGNPLIPAYYVSFTTRDVLVLEFSSTVLSLILAGKIGSLIASEIGTMRVTEQIDALESMGINSAAYLIQPKVIASMIVNPLLVILSIFIGLLGGWFVSELGGLLTTHDFFYGIRFQFDSYKIVYTLIKSVIFAFIITSVSGYFGYYTKGGALEVGKSSTQAVVYSMVFILVANYAVTEIMLT